MSAHAPLAFFGGTPSPGELFFIFVIVLLLFGSKRLPEIARQIGRSMEMFRRAARDVTDEILQTEPEPGEKKTKPAELPPPDTVAMSGESDEETSGEKNPDGNEQDDRPA
jgi:TatA/E family protein of Tat protein translocase